MSQPKPSWKKRALEAERRLAEERLKRAAVAFAAVYDKADSWSDERDELYSAAEDFVTAIEAEERGLVE